MGYEMNTGTQIPTYGSNSSGHPEDGCRTFEQNTGTHLSDYDSQDHDVNSGSNTAEPPFFKI